MRKQLLFLAGAVLLAGCGASKSDNAPPESATSDAPSAPSAPLDPETLGEVSGRVTFAGTKPVSRPISMDAVPACAKQHKGSIPSEDLVVSDKGEIKNAFVYVKSGLPSRQWEVPTSMVTLDQKACIYTPHVLGLMTGQDLEITNSDPTNHNIHPIPRTNKEWNESQPPQGDKKIKQFNQAEIMIPFKCNVHPWMRAYVGVVAHPFFAVTDDDGSFDLKGLPPGDYVLEVWHEKLGTQELKVTLQPKESKTADFAFKA